MKRLIPLAFLALAAPAFAQTAAAPAGTQRPQRAYANPSALIAADIGFARLAREKGQWTAFRETAEDAAEIFEGKRMVAKAVLKDRKDPPAPVKWSPHAAWISCDGSAGLTFGAWQGPSGGNGEYVTVWQRQFKGKVDWKWVLDDGQDLASPLREVDWVEGKVADCPARRDRDGAAPAPGGKRDKAERSKPQPLRPLAGPIPRNDAPAGSDSKDGQSRDGTLAWRSTVLPDGSRRFTAWIWKDGAMIEAVARSFKANGA